MAMTPSTTPITGSAAANATDGDFAITRADRRVPPRTSGAEEDGTDDASLPRTKQGSGQQWTLVIQCKGAPPEKEFFECDLDRTNVSFMTLLSLKEQLGYSVRDFLYYKKRCGRAVATLEPIDYSRDADRMIESNQDEREVRLVVSRERVKDNQVTITPMKRKRSQQNSDDPITNEQLDAYKVWLANLQAKEEHTEFIDDYRDETIKTYKEWLTRKGHLDDILSFLKEDHTNNPAGFQDEESQDSGLTPPERPSHARKNKQQQNGGGSQQCKKGVRGCLKGLKAANKRVKNASQKLSIQFSARLGGPVGENSRTFVDEVVMFTRKRAPLIGVKKWKDIKQNVKITIAEDLLSRWDFPNIENATEKIWDIAKEPTDLTLWMATHMKNGEWSNNASRDVYDDAAFKITDLSTEPDKDFLIVEEENIAFQSSYKESTGTKSCKAHGHGYMAKYPTRSQLLKDRLDEQSRASAAAWRKNNELEDEVQMLKEKIANGVAEREQTRREMQEELEKERNAREQLRQEFLSLLAQQREATLQANQGSILSTRESEANPSEEDENMTTLDKANPDSTLNTTEKTPEHVEETLQQNDPASIVTTQKDARPPIRITRASNLNRSLFQNVAVNNGSSNFIPPQQLKNTATTRSKKRRDHPDETI